MQRLYFVFESGNFLVQYMWLVMITVFVNTKYWTTLTGILIVNKFQSRRILSKETLMRLLLNSVYVDI